jgi:DNA-binding response OmpR family regulator
MLTASGHAVATAADGLAGTISFRANPVDLVLVDMMMPHSGLGTIRVLRSQFPRLKVIAMSGGGSHRLDYARSLGAHCTLAKPFNAEQLATAVASTLAVASTAPDTKN